ncbi:MAG: alpha/beta hydrolase [Treponema sp.]|nr:alpha/beta hydrolase [Treponema sp.]
MKKTLWTLFFIFIISQISFSQDATIYLWKNVSGMKKENSVMYMHKPKSGTDNKGVAVIVCPGGSYHHLGLYNEGYMSTKWFSENGITAFMLKYRSAEENYHHPAMLEDLQRAIQLVRENAEEYGIDKTKVGVIGYSAGGHLVTMAGEFGSTVNELEKLGIHTEESLRPDFCMPVYPVVSMKDPLAHHWSRDSLLGKDQSDERKEKFSMEQNVPSDMPPTYIVVCVDDDVVDYRNSLELNKALSDKGIPDCEFHMYSWGKHGFGMLQGSFMEHYNWNQDLLSWIKRITE